MSRLDIQDQIASYTKLIDECIAENDDEGAAELLEAIEALCDKLDAM